MALAGVSLSGGLLLCSQGTANGNTYAREEVFLAGILKRKSLPVLNKKLS